MNLETIYKTGNSIKGPITSAMAIKSCPGNELIAMASANGELRASVVIVKLAYSSYVKLICSLNNKSIIVFVAKKIINGMNNIKSEFKLDNNKFPSLLKIAKTAKPKNIILYFEKKFIAVSFKFSLKINLVICAKINGITITIKME